MKNIKCLIGKIVEPYNNAENITFETIICWKDGQIDFTGQCLLDNYSDKYSVSDLLKGGDLYRIGDNINNCEYFSRDFDLPTSDTISKKILNKDLNNFIFDHQELEYVYIFRGSMWYVLKNHPVSNDGFEPLLDIITPNKKRRN